MKVVILAGGLGTRLSEETASRPKPMVEIGGEPILWHIMKMYATTASTTSSCCLGYKGYVIKEYFSNYFLHSSDVTFDLRDNSMRGPPERRPSRGGSPWSTPAPTRRPAAASSGSLRTSATSTFMLTYGDGVADVDLAAAARVPPGARQAGHDHGGAAVGPVRRAADRRGRGDASGVRSFQEKPVGDGAWVNGGFFVLEPRGPRPDRRRRHALRARTA